MNLKNYFLAFFLMASISVFSQSYEVSGKVTDGDNAPLPGVGVVVKGTTNGTSTDFDGSFTLNVSNGDVLQSLL